MAKDNRKRAADDGFDDLDKGSGPLPKDFVPTGGVTLDEDDELPTKDNPASPDPIPDELSKTRIELATLKAELAALKATAPTLSGGKFTVAVKDGPTATIEVPAGERPEDAFFAALGIHSCPHRPDVQSAADHAPCGIHYPNGSVRPFGPPA